MNRRRCATAAITVVSALTVLASPMLALPAYAAPAAPLAPEPPPAATQKKTLEEVRKEIDALYRKAAVATDAYNLAEEQAKRQSAEIVELARMIVAGQAKIEELKTQAGAAARAQYRNGGLPEGAQLVLTDDPQLFLDNAGRLKEGQKATKDLLGELTRSQAELTTYTKEASDNWTKLEANRVKQANAKKEINDKIAAAKKLESTLAAEELARLLKLEEDAQYRSQTTWLSSGILKELNGTATPQGRKAVEFATAQIGKPYIWGAEGPGSYDCSGLTQRAWGVAGRNIPRTSQEQWRLLPRVEIKDMRPGDLIVYYRDASHIGMYVGNGAIVHAPRPGRNVTLAGAGSMEILGVVRPER
ncbi:MULTISPECIES: C40 family peptidase [Streptomyces]|uniref:NlpC/P60 family protein n=1 Tax=Streptomyces solicathayae TaxID=3081768 RepID=A0ABZ0LVN5_9ACTN|nr:NlpC/P60 family protein [Streptomyces sp. HUAS YS2]WOX23562.1 NlpC/P60 family protein [Streptomyces sp. HUAS YS2]